MMALNDLVCPLILVRVESISKDLHPRAWVNVLKQVQKDVSSLCQWEKMYRSYKSRHAVNSRPYKYHHSTKLYWTSLAQVRMPNMSTECYVSGVAIDTIIQT